MAAGGFRRVGQSRCGRSSGKTWTALLATQVALSLAILPSAIEMLWGTFRPTILGPGLPVEEFLTASLVMEGDSSRFEQLRIEAVRQLTSEGGISGVTVSAALLMEEPAADIEVEGIEAQDVQARFNSVDDKFFEVFGVRFLAGRSFDASDFGPGRTLVIVNRSFATEVIGAPRRLGRRVRYRDKPACSAKPLSAGAAEGGGHEIVGVVEDFLGNNDGPTMFHPMTRAPHPVSLTIRAPSGIGLAADRLRESPRARPAASRKTSAIARGDVLAPAVIRPHVWLHAGRGDADRAPLLDGRHLHPHGLHRRSAVA